MRIAISGMGLRSSMVLARFRDQWDAVEFVGYYDPQPMHLNDLDPDMPRYDSVAEMLETAKPDLFFIASPNEFHLGDLKAGFAAGVRMFCEKPVVTSIDDTIELAGLLAKHGMDQVMVGLVLRYSRHMVDLRKAIAAGMLGEITSMEASEHIGPHHGAFFMRDWRRKTSRTGGFMLEKCCHDLDLYNMITRSRPKHVASFGAKRSFLPQYKPTTPEEMNVYQMKPSVWDSADDPFNSDADIIDCQTGILEYENGASLAFHTNLNVPDEHRRFCVIGAKGMAEGDFVRGYLHVTDAGSYKRLINEDYKKTGPSKGHYGADAMLVADIVAHLKDPAISLPVTILDALEAGVAALALDQARTGKCVVDLTQTWAKLDAFGLRG